MPFIPCSYLFYIFPQAIMHESSQPRLGNMSVFVDLKLTALRAPRSAKSFRLCSCHANAANRVPTACDFVVQRSIAPLAEGAYLQSSIRFRKKCDNKLSNMFFYFFFWHSLTFIDILQKKISRDDWDNWAWGSSTFGITQKWFIDGMMQIWWRLEDMTDTKVSNKKTSLLEREVRK